VAAIKLYGTTCAAWDQMPDTPWYSLCEVTIVQPTRCLFSLGSSCEVTNGNAEPDWSTNEKNWCQQPWCYVDSTCTGDKVATSVFEGSPISYYSYQSCGGAANCYTGISGNSTFEWPTGCPYNPHGGTGAARSFSVHESGSCACLYQGKKLDASVYTNYPDEKPAGCVADSTVTCTRSPGMYANMASIKWYGTTCAAWDQMPGTPWFSSCPANSEWCNYDFNWCQQPWCYVSSSCNSMVATSVFEGQTVIAQYSYATCLNTPNCYTNISGVAAPTNIPSGCPFDAKDNFWQTAKLCPAWLDKPVQSNHARVAAFTGFAMIVVLATSLIRLSV
jgi:hypothetical protein